MLGFRAHFLGAFSRPFSASAAPTAREACCQQIGFQDVVWGSFGARWFHDGVDDVSCAVCDAMCVEIGANVLHHTYYYEHFSFGYYLHS